MKDNLIWNISIKAIVCFALPQKVQKPKRSPRRLEMGSKYVQDASIIWLLASIYPSSSMKLVFVKDSV